ncbi:class I SAM-dependent methyltransferase [Aureimonas pseudogalii]|uniref:SAM-dependent methyltransferase n=1 Tax=Aureimonas pseudogalii TaxID=1744844 RepID=A0A7W6H8B6_9HYPH|nr:class I SAM-dependent methyltransferase [Aureimonas pseudogalii]MBB4000441.1 SAM-dependent methyltransferase [Aureimonas pseudogalii]
MTDWASGYVADIDYIPGFYAEQMPSHLDLACLIRGVYPPRQENQPFTYCELGCGLGETALTLAACHPEAEIHAFDFNPAHIAYATQTARCAGLSNIHFAERSFAELAKSGEGELPLFDYVTLHGIWTWIARAHQLEIIEILARFVRPGGVVAVTYNALPGWSRQMPIQRLLYDFAATQDGPSDRRVNAALGFAEAIQQAGSIAIDEEFVKFLLNKRELGLTYLAHEYLNGSWQPVYHADLAADLAHAKLSYVASATLLENFPAIFLSEEQRRLVEAVPAAMRETLKDHFNPRIFRRDVFVRGARAIAPLPKARLLESKRLTLADAKAQLAPKLTLPSGEIEFKSPFYAFMGGVLTEGDASLAELRAKPGAPPSPNNEEILAVGIETRNAITVQHLPTAHELERLRSVNLAFVRNAIEHGRPSITLAACAIQSGLQIPLLSMLAYEALATQTPETVEALAARCLELLQSRGEQLRRDGEIIQDEGEVLSVMRRKAESILSIDLPVWRRIGAF